MLNKIDPKILVDLYKKMDEETRQEEIDAIFELIFAMLESCECDSIETYINPNVILKFSCEVIKDGSSSIN